MIMSDTDSRAGSDFGHYRLRRLIGRGGMGEVYEAEDTRKDRIVALKLLPMQFTNDPVFRKRLQREAQTAGRLQEPHVVPIHDYGEIDGTLYVDMRLIDGTDLRSVLGRYGPLTPARAVAIVKQVASALDAANQSGLMHRDVKPENILITKEDFAYLVDFGIASAVTDERLTQLGTAVGTYAYMAPERFSSAEVTYRADIYALGCVLYECLTGSQPYRADSMSVLIAAHLMQPVPRPSASRPGVPAAFDAVIARAMAKDPNDRYGSAGELATAAHDALASPDQQKADTILAGSASALPQYTPPPQQQSPYYTPPPVQTSSPGQPVPSHPTPPPTPATFAAASSPTGVPPGQQPPGPPPYGGQPSWQSGPMPPPGPRKRNLVPIIGAIAAVVVLLIAGVVAIVLVSGSDDDSDTIASSSSSSSSSRSRTSSTTRTTEEETTTPVVPPTAPAGEKWTAIVYSAPERAWGWANNASSKDEATELATTYCKQYGGTDCRPAAWSTRCVALAVSDSSWHGGIGATIAEAENDAVAQNKGGTVQVSKCATG